MTSDCKCFDGLYKSQHEDIVSSQVGEFLDAVQSMVDGKNVENVAETERKSNTPANFSLDDDYMPLAERYDAGIATEEETEELQADVLNAAKEAMLNTKIADENGSMAQ